MRDEDGDRVPRVSTNRQASEGYGLEAQRSAISRRAEYEGWQQVRWVEDPGKSGATVNRPGLAYALALLRDGHVDALVVSHLDRLSRSVLDFADLLGQARDERWNLVVLDLNLDLASPHREFVAHVLAAVAQLERRLIAERVRVALGEARSRGVKTGPKPREVPAATLDRIYTLRERGRNLSEVAHALNTEGVPLPSGRTGCWQPA